MKIVYGLTLLAVIFIIAISKNPNIIFELSIEQERFHQTMEAIKIRNEFHVNEYQILAEKINCTVKV